MDFTAEILLTEEDEEGEEEEQEEEGQQCEGAAGGGRRGGDEARGRGKQLGNDQRDAILQALLGLSDRDRNLNHGAVKSVSKQFQVNRRTVSNIWKACD
jgi:hypothetical protein